jgi:hypothetical protein
MEKTKEEIARDAAQAIEGYSKVVGELAAKCVKELGADLGLQAVTDGLRTAAEKAEAMIGAVRFPNPPGLAEKIRGVARLIVEDEEGSYQTWVRFKAEIAGAHGLSENYVGHLLDVEIDRVRKEGRK